MKHLKSLLLFSLITGSSCCLAQSDVGHSYGECSPGGKLFLTANFDSLRYRLFDVTLLKWVADIKPGFVRPNPEKEKLIPGGRIPITMSNPSVATFSKDGKLIYLAYNYSIAIWDLAQQKVIFRINDAYFYGPTTDGQQLIARKGKTIYWYNTSNWKVARRVKVTGPALVSADGKLIAEADNFLQKKLEIRLIDAASGKTTRSLAQGLQYNLPRAFSPDAKLLLSEYQGEIDKDTPKLMFWDVGSSALIDSLAGDLEPLFNPGGNKLLTVSRDPLGNSRYLDSSPKVWNVATRKLDYELTHAGGVLTAVKYSPDGQLIVGSWDDGSAMVFDASTGQLIQKLPGEGGFAEALGFDTTSRYVVTASVDQSIQAWDAKSGALQFTVNGAAIMRP